MSSAVVVNTLSPACHLLARHYSFLNSIPLERYVPHAITVNIVYFLPTAGNSNISKKKNKNEEGVVTANCDFKNCATLAHSRQQLLTSRHNYFDLEVTTF
jgi:hypothetical protein